MCNPLYYKQEDKVVIDNATIPGFKVKPEVRNRQTLKKQTLESSWK